MARKFYLKNGLGNQYELSDRNFKHFLNVPQGLGFAKNISTLRLGDSEQVISSNYNMPQPSGEMLFYDVGSQYQDYFEFVNFLSFEPIYLYYIPQNTIEPYFIKCEVVELQKSEIYYEDRIMHCPIAFYGTTMWLKARENTLSLSNVMIEDGKYYDLVRPYNYGGSALANITIDNDGQLPSGFILEIDGEVQNPQLSAYDTNGNMYGIMKFNGTYDYVRINTNDNEQEIYLERNGSVIANPTSYQDLSIADGKATLTFFKLIVGQSKLVFNSGNIDTFDGEVVLRWNSEFISI